jgi:hypothetical protein
VCFIFLKLQTGADDDNDMPISIDVKDVLDVDLQKKITVAFDSNTTIQDLSIILVSIFILYGNFFGLFLHTHLLIRRSLPNPLGRKKMSIGNLTSRPRTGLLSYPYR